MWVTSTLSQESAVKISAQSEQRAKSYACFTEGMSRYGSKGEGGGGTESGRVFLLATDCGCGGWVK